MKQMWFDNKFDALDWVQANGIKQWAISWWAGKVCLNYI